MQFRNTAVLLLVGLAALGTCLVLPRPTRTQLVPLPSIDLEARQLRENEEQARARHAEQKLLPTRARIIGEEFRRLGRALVERDPAAARLTRELELDTARLLEAGHAEELLLLRALQGELFVAAARAFYETAQESRELNELGSDFVSSLVPRHRAAGLSELTSDQLRLLFRVRWGRLVGVHRLAPFGPNLEEFRRFYALQLQLRAKPDAYDPTLEARAQLEAVQALAALDPTYPADLAAGLVLLRVGESDAALVHLRRHVQTTPNGPWGLVARNSLVLAGGSKTEW